MTALSRDDPSLDDLVFGNPRATLELRSLRDEVAKLRRQLLDVIAHPLPPQDQANLPREMLAALSLAGRGKQEVEAV